MPNTLIRSGLLSLSPMITTHSLSGCEIKNCSQVCYDVCDLVCDIWGCWYDCYSDCYCTEVVQVACRSNLECQAGRVCAAGSCVVATSPAKALCEACSAHSDCLEQGALCVQLNNQTEKVCGRSCSSDSNCPTSYSCSPVGTGSARQLRKNIENPKNAIVIVVYQAPHTLGRRIVERQDRVRIFGAERDLNAEVVVLDGCSAHADQGELVWWANACGRQVRNFFLVHGEPPACEALRQALVADNRAVLVPSEGQTVELSFE